jgi:putative membrane protein
MMPIHPLWFLMGFGWLVFVVGLVLFVVWLIRATARPVPAAPASAPPHAETPLEILARRFAAGEITADEYTKARELLQGEPPVQK